MAEQRAEEANNLRNQMAASQHFNNDVDDDRSQIAKRRIKTTKE